MQLHMLQLGQRCGKASSSTTLTTAYRKVCQGLAWSLRLTCTAEPLEPLLQHVLVTLATVARQRTGTKLA